ncbi:MAG: 2-hydroxychromene-2-carboxylate isomerase [Burkholderiales bacterium]|nr:2-hydroxychromene-2-carboxylate isomerase [Burkholderiales bacterium]
MTKTVDYYFTPVSPWTWLGHERFAAMCARHGATIRVKPCDIGGRIFPVSGGLPLAKRAPQRQAYRMMELKRWRSHLGIALTLEPKYFPTNPELASLLIVAATRLGPDPAMALSAAILRACWVEDKDVSDAATLRRTMVDNGFDADVLMRMAHATDVRAAYEANTQEAIDRGVFGAPTFAIDDELFWGQDRLEFVERALAGTAAPAQSQASPEGPAGRCCAV